MDVPELDDITFAQLVEDAKKRIPQYNTEWTDYNIHDAGITLIELFAWLSEMQVFFLNQITEKDKKKFIKLLGSALQKCENLNEAILVAQKDLKKPYRAVTLDDYEFLAKQTPNVNVARVQAFWNLDKVEVIVGVKSPTGVNVLSKPSEEDKMRVCMHLDKGRLLTTLIEVIDPHFVIVTVRADIRTKPLASADLVTQQIIVKLEEFLNPLIGGWDKKGWPFGRSVYKSEIITLIESVEGVDCVQTVTLSAEGDVNDFSLEKGNIIIHNHALVDSGLPVINVLGFAAPCRRYTI